MLPLTLRDVDRSEILRRSLDLFFPDLGTCWVVVPDGQYEVLRARIRQARYRVIAESLVVPELGFYNLGRTAFGRRHKPLNGWQVQQLIKLAIADHVESEFYLTLDADVICARPVRFSDLIRNGRARAERGPHHFHRQWYVWAGRLLGMPTSERTHSVTPCLLNREVVMLLQRRLATRVNPALRTLSRLLPQRAWKNGLAGWRSYLLRNVPWTEYGLYFNFLEGLNLFDRYYFIEDGCTVSGNDVWNLSQLATWQPEKSFRGERGFFFSVVQSNTGIDADEVWRRVRDYLRST